MSGCSGMAAIRLSAFRASSSSPGEDAVMRKEGDRLVIEPAPPRSLLAVLRSLQPIEEDFPAIEELPHSPVEL